VSSSEERRDDLTAELVSIDYRLTEHLGGLEDYQVPEVHTVLKYGQEYADAEEKLLAGLSRTKTVEYLKAKSRLLYEHSSHMD
jgi:hypothetical protein